jgi:hypothetical protein
VFLQFPGSTPRIGHVGSQSSIPYPTHEVTAFPRRRCLVAGAFLIHTTDETITDAWNSGNSFPQ